MATNIINYAPDATPPSPTSAPSITVQPVVSRPAPGPSTGRGLWEGRLRPAEIQIIVIVVIAGLFNAFFLILSLRLLWRRYHPSPRTGEPPAALPALPGVESNLRRITPMLVRQPDDELVYGLKQVLDQDDSQKAAAS